MTGCCRLTPAAARERLRAKARRAPLGSGSGSFPRSSAFLPLWPPAGRLPRGNVWSELGRPGRQWSALFSSFFSACSPCRGASRERRTADPNVRVNGATLSPERDPSAGSSPPAGAGRAMDALATPPARHWAAALAVAVAVLAAYVLVMLIGVRQDAQEQRILGSLTPIFIWLRDTGADTQTWLQHHRRTADLGGTVLLLGIAAAALVRRRRGAAPVALLVAAFLLATWAQVALQSDSTTLGAVLYLAAAAAALALGV